MAFGVNQVDETKVEAAGRWAKTQLTGLIATVVWLVSVGSIFVVLGVSRGQGGFGPEMMLSALVLLAVPIAMIWLYVMLVRQSQVTEMALFHQIADLERFQILPQAAETHMAQITDIFRDQARDFNKQAEQALDTFAELSNSFDDQSRRMSTLATNVHKQTDSVKETLQTQADQILENMDGVSDLQRQIHSSIDMVRGLRAEMEINVSEPMADMEASIAKSTDRVYKLVDELWQHLEGVEKAYEDAEAMARRTSKTFLADAELLEDVAKGSVEQLEVLSEALGPQIDRLAKVQNSATQQADRIVEQVEDQVFAMGKIGSELKSQADILTDAVRDQVNHLDYLMKAVDDYGATISMQFEKQVDDLLRTADEASKSLVSRTEEAAGSMQVNLDAHAGQLEKISRNLDDQVATACDSVEGRIRESINQMETMQDSVEGVIKTANNEITLLVAGFSKDLSLAGQQAMEDLLRISGDLPNLTDRMANAAEDAVARIHTANKDLVYQSEQVTGVAGDILSYGDKIKDDLLALPKALENAFLSVDTQYGDLSQDLRNLTADLSDTAKDSKTTFAQLKVDMELQLGDVAQAMRKLNQDSRDLHVAFNDNVRALEGTTGKAKAILDAALDHLHEEAAAAVTTTKSFMEEIRELSDHARDDIERLSATSATAIGTVRSSSSEVSGQLREFEEQAGRLKTLIDDIGASAVTQQGNIAAIAKAGGNASAMLQGIHSGERDAFLKAAGDLVSALQSAAIDVEGILSGTVPQDVLEAFQSGDRSVAVRRLLRRNTPLGATKISEQYSSDKGFKTKIDAYVATFEDLLARAENADPSKLLHTTFLTADIGKLYVFLTQSLGYLKAAE